MKPLLRKLSDDEMLDLDIIVTAMHLEEKYGYTYQQIENDGFTIAYKIPLQLVDTSRQTISKSMAILQLALTDI